MITLAPRQLVAAGLRSAGTGWSIGEHGALGEFRPDAACEVTGTTAVAGSGAIRLEPGTARAIAYEIPSAAPGRWMHGVAFCLPRQQAAMAGRSAIQELGPDADAICAADRAAIVFDLGLGLRFTDFCVRTADAALIASLRRAQGVALRKGSALWSMLLDASPHRVIRSRIGRIEVFAPIPQAHGHSPPDSHTHLLFELLGRTCAHSALLPIPGELAPCAFLYPPHPCADRHGRPQPFDAAVHDSFQAVMAAYGTGEQLAAKRQVQRGVALDAPPSGATLPQSRHGRLAARVAVRQLVAAGVAAARLREWADELEPKNLRSAAPGRLVTA